MTFDSVLQYVAFPPVTVEKWSPARPKEGTTPTDQVDITDLLKSGATGRADLVFFFKWLREKKNVERILRVMVDDSVSPPHSDEAIEMALRPFGVETLDWSKPDLDPETIINSSQELRELHLHWNGNNAVLRSWSDPEGLRRLPNLSVIHLSVDSVSLAHVLLYST